MRKRRRENRRKEDETRRTRKKSHFSINQSAQEILGPCRRRDLTINSPRRLASSHKKPPRSPLNARELIHGPSNRVHCHGPALLSRRRLDTASHDEMRVSPRDFRARRRSKRDVRRRCLHHKGYQPRARLSNRAYRGEQTSGSLISQCEQRRPCSTSSLSKTARPPLKRLTTITLMNDGTTARVRNDMDTR